MQRKTFFVVSLVLSAAMLAALFLLQAIMPGVADRWMNQDVDLNSVQKTLYMVFIFWSRFWWLAWPFVIGAAFTIVGGIAMLRRAVPGARQRAGE
jgi:type II secretory pathway component PulF